MQKINNSQQQQRQQHSEIRNRPHTEHYSTFLSDCLFEKSVKTKEWKTILMLTSSSARLKTNGRLGQQPVTRNRRDEPAHSWTQSSSRQAAAFTPNGSMAAPRSPLDPGPPRKAASQRLQAAPEPMLKTTSRCADWFRVCWLVWAVLALRTRALRAVLTGSDCADWFGLC